MLGVTEVFGGGWGGLGTNGDFGGCWWQRRTLLSICCLVVVAFDMVRLSGARMGVSQWFDITRLCLILIIISVGFSEVVCNMEGIWWRRRAVGTFGCWFVIDRSWDLVAGRLGVVNDMAGFFKQCGVILRHCLARLRATEQPRCCQGLFWHVRTWVLCGFCCLWWF